MAQMQWDLSSMSPVSYILLVVVAISLLLVGSIFMILSAPNTSTKSNGLVTYARFFYASFLKPHTGDGADTGQQAALESFYKAQVCGNGSLVSHLSRYANIYVKLVHFIP